MYSNQDCKNEIADDPQPIANNPSTGKKKTPGGAFEFLNQMLKSNPIQSDRYYCDYYASNTIPANSQEPSVEVNPFQDDSY